MAAEHRARAKAHREQRLKETERMLPVMQGNLESIFGRILTPGEVPSAGEPLAPARLWENES